MVIATTGTHPQMETKLVKRIFALLGALSLCGCANSPIATSHARLAYDQSVTDYRACLSANQTNVRACDGKRLLMETDERSYNNHTAEISRLSAGSGTTCTTIGNTTNCY